MSKSEQYLYVIRPVRLAMVTDGPTEDESKILEQHFNYLSDLAKRNVVEIAGRTQNSDEMTFGIVLLHARSEKEAAAIMQADPAVSEGLMIPELFPFRVAVRAPG